MAGHRATTWPRRLETIAVVEGHEFYGRVRVIDTACHRDQVTPDPRTERALVSPLAGREAGGALHETTRAAGCPDSTQLSAPGKTPQESGPVTSPPH